MATAVALPDLSTPYAHYPKPNNVVVMKARRLCRTCSTPISEKRLLALPNAVRCVPCTEQAGDVTVIRRFDEPGSDGERTETYFQSNRYLDAALTRSPAHYVNALRDSSTFESYDEDPNTMYATDLATCVKESEVDNRLEREADRQNPAKSVDSQP